MGGMAVEYYASGAVLDSQGNPYYDSDRARMIAREKVASFIPIGSPADLHGTPPYPRWTSTVMEPVTEVVNSFTDGWLFKLPGMGPDRAPPDQSFHEAIERARRIAKVPVMAAMKRAMPLAVANVDNFDPERHEFERILETGFGGFNAHIGNSFSRWQNSGEITAPNGFNYSKNARVHVPTLVIAGELDGLAPTDSLFRHALRMQPDADKLRRLEVMDTSHVDLMAGERSVRLVLPKLLEFVENPADFGQAGKRMKLEDPLAEPRACDLGGFYKRFGRW
jgi:pimeloyl-ACP methyl ester carboxylesterase